MNIDYVLVGDKNMPPITKQSDLIGKHIGTLLGYRYPEIEYLFEKKLAYREDAPTHDSAILKQKLKRTDYTIVRQTQFRYLQKIDVNFANLMASARQFTAHASKLVNYHKNVLRRHCTNSLRKKP
jgi:hypothetical protein